jgi:hypothetical protein
VKPFSNDLLKNKSKIEAKKWRERNEKHKRNVETPSSSILFAFSNLNFKCKYYEKKFYQWRKKNLFFVIWKIYFFFFSCQAIFLKENSIKFSIRS